MAKDDVVELFFKTPLYEGVRFASPGYSGLNLFRIVQYSSPIDWPCSECGQASIFRRTFPPDPAPIAPISKAPPPITPVGGASPIVVRAAKAEYTPPDLTWRETSVQLTCSRNNAHVVRFWFLYNDQEIVKVGQYPSLADLHSDEIERFRKPLGAARYAELARGVGLVAHGIGIGGFVYLRRIFESLIEGARKEAGSAIDDSVFLPARMDEKIALLREHLPAFLVENRSVYGMLSKGIHALSEDECKEHFPTVLAAIEIILDEHIERAARKKREHAARVGIAALRQRLTPSDRNNRG